MKRLGYECPVLIYKEQGIKSNMGILDVNVLH